RLLHFDRHGRTARLTCMNSETGKELWRFEYATTYEDSYGYNNGPRACPVVDGDRIYIFGAEGLLHCVKLADGALLWKVDTAKKFNVVKNFFGAGSTPVVEGKLLIMQIGGSPPDSPPVASGRVKGAGSGIVAFDKLTGKLVYQVTDELASYSSPALATIGGRRWGFVFARGGLVGFEPTSGKVDFHYPWRAKITESVNASNPVVIGDRVLISETYGPGTSLLRVRPGGYDVLWRDERGSRRRLQTHWNTAIHHQGFIYGSSGRHSGGAELRCLKLETGEVMWKQPGLSRSSLLYVDGHFVCLTEYGRLLLLRADPKRYHPVAAAIPLDADAKPLLAYPAWAAPILSHGLLYVRGKERLVCMELIPQEK
ncbi:MAG: PQQ-like beta-propeller repeat protein, partial [Phycisphaerae bacterium]|nr:PQQ-like beta-propeller repeat protein [Phycisphaerae bacterium]